MTEFLDTFAGSQFDVCRTHLIRHRIDTHDAPPFKERGRAPLLAWRDFLDKELDSLLALRHISEADQGLCPFASRCVALRRRPQKGWVYASALITDG